jgi:8-amino-7-oxononanoate synthase
MPSDVVSIWKAGLRKDLRALEERNLCRTLAEIRGINFCSNDYLGLAENSALRQSLLESIGHASRVGGTGSRLLSGQTGDWQELEERFAEFAGTEAALFFCTGYAANLGLLASLVGKDDVIYSDELNHASLIDGMRLSGARKVIYPHLDLQALELALREDSGAPWRRVIVTESVFSMDGDLAPLGPIAELAEKYGAALIVDEAHATGVHGPSGRGLAVGVGIAGQVLASVHTCGKALGSAGAFVCGPEVLKDYLVNHARTFMFSTALPPYFAQQIGAALEIALTMDQERRELLQHAARLAEHLRAAGFKTAGSTSQIVPVVLGNVADTLDAADYLQRDGFAVRAIRPPTVPDGSARLRLSLTSKIPEAELKRLVKSLVSWRSLRVSAAVAKHA